MTFVMVCGSGSGAYAAETESQNGNWAIIIGDEEILYVDSEEAGKQVIEGLKNYYLSEGSNVLDVQFDPQIQVSQIFEIADDEFAAMSGSVCDIEEAVKRLSEGKNEYYVYKTKEGDSLDSLAKEKDLIADKLVKLNFDEYESDETIKEGTYIVLYKEVPYVHVTTVEEVTSTKSIDYDTVYKKTSSLKKGEMKIQKKGKKGQKQVVRQLTKVNGKTTSSELISSEVIQEPTDKVVLKGTGTVTAKAGKTFDFVDGSEVVDYAKNFIGNPYSYGGTSLTNGADCSGFVYSIFKHFGVNLPRVGQSGVGKAVSYKNVNERLGIRITSVGYTGSVIAVRRIFD